MKASVVPYSGIVGSSILLTDEDGKIIGHLALHSVITKSDETHRQASDRIAKQVEHLINSRK